LTTPSRSFLTKMVNKMENTIAVEESPSKKHHSGTAISTAKRAMGLSKTYIVISIVFTLFALTIWNPYNYISLKASLTNSTNSTTNSISSNIISTTSLIEGNLAKNSYALIAVPLETIPTIMVVTPVLLLFVYDKNNGVLEYLLSLGLDSRDIYLRYLKAALLMICVYLIIFTSINFAVSIVIHGESAAPFLAPISILVAGLSLAAASLMVTMMMVFSSLQKPRTGSNQPLGILIGFAVTIPAYLVPFILPFSTAVKADAILIIVLAIITVSLIRSSKKLIRKEKFLP
jgi:hypothetical protein